MKLKKILPLLMSILLLAAALAGCGGSNKLVAMDNSAAYDSPGAPMEMSNSLSESTSGSAKSLPENRKWIITVHMTAETGDLDAMLASVDQKIADLHGYMEGQSLQNGKRSRSAYLTVRIPADQVDAFTEEVTGISNVIRQEKDLDDVTLDYVATESRINALEVEQTRLLELLAKAENMSDLLEIESRLTDVRYELERYGSQLRLYNNQIDYATIYLNIEEVKEFTPVAEPTLWQRIQNGFSSSLKTLYHGAQDFLVALVAASPFLVLCGIVAAVVLLIIRAVHRRKASRRPSQSQNSDPTA